MNFLSVIMPFYITVIVVLLLQPMYTPVSTRHISKRSTEREVEEPSDDIRTDLPGDSASNAVTDMYLDIVQNNQSERFLLPMWLIYYRDIIENILLHQQMIGLASGTQEQDGAEINDAERSETEHEFEFSAELPDNDQSDVPEIETIEAETRDFTENTGVDEQQIMESNHDSVFDDYQEAVTESQTEAPELDGLYDNMQHNVDQDNNPLEFEQDEPDARDIGLLLSTIATGASTLPTLSSQSSGGLFHQLIQSAIDLMPTVTTSQTGGNLQVFEQGDHQVPVTSTSTPNDDFLERNQVASTHIPGFRDDNLIDSLSDERDTNNIEQEFGQTVDRDDTQQSVVNDDVLESVGGIAGINQSGLFTWRQENDASADRDNGDVAEFVGPGFQIENNNAEPFELADNDTDTSNT